MMKKLTVTFLLLFLSFFAWSQKPILHEVSVDITQGVNYQRIFLTWDPLPFNAVDILVLIERGEDNPGTIFQINKKDSIWYDTINSLTSYNYYLYSNTTGGGKIPLQRNMVLQIKNQLPDCANSLRLSWTPYINMNNGIDPHGTDIPEYYKVFRRYKDSGNKFDTIARVDHSNNPDFLDEFLDNDTTYEYVVQAFNDTCPAHPFSNIASAKTGTQDKEHNDIIITRVSVEKDNKEIHIDIDVDGDKSYEYVSLYKLNANVDDIYNRSKFDSLLKIKPDTISKKDSSNFISNKTIIDNDVNPTRQLHYYVAEINHKCKPNKASNVLTNIFLYGKRVKEYVDSVFYIQIALDFINPTTFNLNQILKYDTVIIDYSRRRSDKFEIDVNNFSADGFDIKYLITSLRKTYLTKSNTLEIEHEPEIDFPNAFNPKSFYLENQTFYPIIKFASDINYEFLIYNRWGALIYSTNKPPIYGEYTDPTGRWDGKDQKGKDCPAGVYAYKLFYNFNEGKRTFKSGTFMLVR